MHHVDYVYMMLIVTVQKKLHQTIFLSFFCCRSQKQQFCFPTHFTVQVFSRSPQLSSNNGSCFYEYHLPHFPVKHVSSGLCLTTQEWYEPTAGHRGKKGELGEMYYQKRIRAIMCTENACWRRMVIRFHCHSVGLTDGFKSYTFQLMAFI